MELRYLRAFIAVAEELHFGRAAIRLGLAQPPLSRQIQRLEAEIGARLFERSPRAVALTEAGHRFLEEIRPLLQRLDNVMEKTRRVGAGQGDRLSVGFASNLTYSVIPKIVQTLAVRVPALRCEWLELPTPEQIAGLREQRLDVGLATLPIDDPELMTRRFLQEPLVAVLPKKHLLADAPDIRLADLVGDPFVLCPRYRRTGFHQVILDLCKAAGFSPHIVHAATSKALLAELVAAGAGVSLVPASAASAAQAEVVYRPLSDAGMTIEVAFIWLRENSNSSLRAFIECALAAVRA